MDVSDEFEPVWFVRLFGRRHDNPVDQRADSLPCLGCLLALHLLFKIFQVMAIHLRQVRRQHGRNRRHGGELPLQVAAPRLQPVQLLLEA